MSIKSFGVGSLMRAITVISAAVIVATGVTFAALDSPGASLLNNSISSATADLRIGTSATSFAATRTGFEFKDVMPGGAAMPVNGNSFWLKNYGSGALNIKAAISSVPVTAGGVDLTKVLMVLTRVDTASTQTISLQALMNGYTTGSAVPLTDQIAGATAVEYKLQFKMAADAFTGTSASIDDVDLVFVGTGIN